MVLAVTLQMLRVCEISHFGGKTSVKGTCKNEGSLKMFHPGPFVFAQSYLGQYAFFLKTGKLTYHPPPHLTWGLLDFSRFGLNIKS